MTKEYIITDKSDNRIIAMGAVLDTQNNGNWWLKNENTAFPNTICYAYDADGQIAETDGSKPANIGEPIEIPEGVEIEKYLYTAENGFVENPNYEAPTGD